MSDPKSSVKAMAEKLGTITTLYMHVNGDGSFKAAGEALLKS
ncbi:MAG: hypothetical protein ETSY1_43015 [Candidatus Entotheonella factor]|uniref:Uncharacterized protein n=1 Tax=Entotheonella factor TaxID=1429438 RepID=W4L3G8_ENTF1|nr:hypothetical protein [Candidatus Entotheonella palauensis]ETW92587.1 MAG: hypothetical protein ETSY1_43015 [Candidatus Entotheonella factor]